MTATRGIGRAPLGVGPYGFGTPATTSLPGGKVHPSDSGTPDGSLLISDSPGTRGQYVFDAYGRRRGCANVRHMVSLAMRTERGSSAVTDIGHRFKETRVVGDNFATEQTGRVNEALKDLVDGKFIRIDSVTVISGDGRPSKTLVRLTDLLNEDSFELEL